MARQKLSHTLTDTHTHPHERATKHAHALTHLEREKIELLAAVWAQTLPLTPQHSAELKNPLECLNFKFFSLGGDSILSLLLVSRARECGLRLRTQDVFNKPSLLEMARVCKLPHTRERGTESAGERARERERERERARVFGVCDMGPVQREFFLFGLDDMNLWTQVSVCVCMCVCVCACVCVCVGVCVCVC